MNGMLTERQSQVLEFIRGRMEERGSAPSLREIMARFGFRSPATVASHLDLMEKKGVIHRERGRSRNITLRTWMPRTQTLDIPVFGAIPAGFPEEQEQRSERSLSIDPATLGLPKNARTFALEVRGDSMINAGIMDGDLVVLERTEARHRDIVAALIDGDTTLKRYLIQHGQSFLRAENPSYPDIIPARELIIQGVFRALIRTHQP